MGWDNDIDDEPELDFLCESKESTFNMALCGWYDAKDKLGLNNEQVVYVEAHIGGLHVKAIADVPYHLTDCMRKEGLLPGTRCSCWKDLKIDHMNKPNSDNLEFVDGRCHVLSHEYR